MSKAIAAATAPSRSAAIPRRNAARREPESARSVPSAAASANSSDAGAVSFSANRKIPASGTGAKRTRSIPSAGPVEASARAQAPSSSSAPRRRANAPAAARSSAGAPITIESAKAALPSVKYSVYGDDTDCASSSTSGASSKARGTRRPARRAGSFAKVARSRSVIGPARLLRPSSTIAGKTAGAESAIASVPQQATHPRLRAVRRGFRSPSASAHAPESRPAINIACGSPAYAIRATAAPAQASRFTDGASTQPITASTAIGTLPAPIEYGRFEPVTLIT